MAQTYIVSGTLLHDHQEYHDGSEFSSDDEKLVAGLVKRGVLKLPEQFAADAAAEGNVGPMRELVATRDAQAQRIAELEAQLAALQGGQQPESGQDSGTSGGDGEPPKSDGEEQQQ